MEAVKGCQLDQCPYGPLKLVADLLYYEGPFLSLLEGEGKTDFGENYYFCYGCDVEANCERWLIFRVTDKQIRNYLMGKNSLREIILHPVDNYYFIGEMIHSEWQQPFYLVMQSDLPELYLPKENSFFDKELDGVSEEDWAILEQRFLSDAKSVAVNSWLATPDMPELSWPNSSTTKMVSIFSPYNWLQAHNEVFTTSQVDLLNLCQFQNSTGKPNIKRERY